MSDKHPTENSTALIIGGETKVVGLAVAGKLFVFNPSQMNFLINLQKLKNVTAASLSVDKTEEWGQNFLRSRKFKDYIACKMQEFSVKNGLTVEWWYQFGKWSADGYKEFYNVSCPECTYKGTMNTYEVESYRSDEGQIESVPCPVCYKAAEVELVHDVFKPTREQVVAWQAMGDRIIPKIERVAHSFTDETIIFENSGGQ